MTALFQITYSVILPIFLLIGVGYVVQKHVGFDLKSLTRLNFWIFVPAFLFVRIFSSTLSGEQLLRIFSHFALLFVSQFALVWFLAPLFFPISNPPGARSTLAATTAFPPRDWPFPVASASKCKRLPSCSRTSPISRLVWDCTRAGAKAATGNIR